jgi:hypothetical protein
MISEVHCSMGWRRLRFITCGCYLRKVMVGFAGNIRGHSITCRTGNEYGTTQWKLIARKITYCQVIAFQNSQRVLHYCRIYNLLQSIPCLQESTQVHFFAWIWDTGFIDADAISSSHFYSNWSLPLFNTAFYADVQGQQKHCAYPFEAEVSTWWSSKVRYPIHREYWPTPCRVPQWPISPYPVYIYIYIYIYTYRFLALSTSALKMEAVYSSKTSIPACKTTGVTTHKTAIWNADVFIM